MKVRLLVIYMKMFFAHLHQTMALILDKEIADDHLNEIHPSRRKKNFERAEHLHRSALTIARHI